MHITYLEQIVLSVLVRVIRGLRDVEGRPSRQHLVGQHAQRPPVHGEAVLLAAEDLGRDVVGRPAERGRRVAGPDALLE